MTMMMMNKKVLILFLLVLITSTTYAQDNDFGIWLGVSAQHDLMKKLDVELSGCLRTFNNTSQVEQYFLEGGLQYKFNKHLSASGSYRIINTLEDDSRFYFRHKLFIDLKGSVPYRNFDFSARLRMQRTTRTYIEDTEDLTSKYYGRVKLKAAYNTISFPLNPYIYIESFSPVFSDSGFKISKSRLSAGTELRITRKSSLEAEYIFQRDYQPDISDMHIISINYKFKF